MMSLIVSENKKLINLPEYMWQFLDKDARRCRRSVTKQIEAILISYFDLEDVEINQSDVERAQSDQGLVIRRKRDVRNLTEQEARKILNPLKDTVPVTILPDEIEETEDKKKTG